MVWLAVLALPHASFAVHVRVTENSFGQRPGACTSLNVRSTAPPQSSLAEGEENVGDAGHSIVPPERTPLITRDRELGDLGAGQRLRDVHLAGGPGGGGHERGSGALGRERPQVAHARLLRGLAERLHRVGAGRGRTGEAAAEPRVGGEREILVG